MCTKSHLKCTLCPTVFDMLLCIRAATSLMSTGRPSALSPGGGGRAGDDGEAAPAQEKGGALNAFRGIPLAGQNLVLQRIYDFRCLTSSCFCIRGNACSCRGRGQLLQQRRLLLAQKLSRVLWPAVPER